VGLGVRITRILARAAGVQAGRPHSSERTV
jgi:hypothetical protein